MIVLCFQLICAFRTRVVRTRGVSQDTTGVARRGLCALVCRGTWETHSVTADAESAVLTTTAAVIRTASTTTVCPRAVTNAVPTLYVTLAITSLSAPVPPATPETPSLAATAYPHLWPALSTTSTRSKPTDRYNTSLGFTVFRSS